MVLKKIVLKLKPSLIQLTLYVAAILLIITTGLVYFWQHNEVNQLNQQIKTLKTTNFNLKTNNLSLEQNNKMLSNQILALSKKPTVSFCESSNFVVERGNGSGAAGTVYQDYLLTNSSNTTCTITGYPKVNFISNNGQYLSQASSNTSNSQILTIQAKQTVKLTIGTVDSTCGTQVANLQFILPSNTLPVPVSMGGVIGGDYCTNNYINSFQTLTK